MGAFSFSVEPELVVANRTVAEASPTVAGDGFDITVIKPHQLVAVFLGAVTGDCTLTGPVRVHGYHKTLGWHYIGDLNKGDNIALINGGSGFSEVLQHARNFERLEFQEGAISANGYKIHVAGVDVVE